MQDTDNLFETVVEYNDEVKNLYTIADSEEEAGDKFNRYIVCHWVGYPWDGPESLLAGTFDKLENGAII